MADDAGDEDDPAPDLRKAYQVTLKRVKGCTGSAEVVVPRGSILRLIAEAEAAGGCGAIKDGAVASAATIRHLLAGEDDGGAIRSARSVLLPLMKLAAMRISVDRAPVPVAGKAPAATTAPLAAAPPAASPAVAVPSELPTAPVAFAAPAAVAAEGVGPMSAAAEAEAVEPAAEPLVQEFSVTVTESGSEGIGLDVMLNEDGLSLLVKAVKLGLVHDWNKQPRNPQIRPGDVIVEVNGIREDPARMVSECQAFQVLRLKLYHSPSPRPKDPLPPLPLISKARIALLGGDTFFLGVGKSDVAAAVMCGITADWPGFADPVYEFVFDFGVFERAWAEMSFDFVPTGERWGIGPLSAWYPDKVHFCAKGPAKTTPPFDMDPSMPCTSLCIGSPENLSFGHNKVYREALIGVGHDIAGIEATNRELYAASEANPHVLVRKTRPCRGVSASFARFSPDVGAFAGCGAAILHVFEPGWHPSGSNQNVAALYAVSPNSKAHKGISPGSFLSALQGAGANIARLLREYNWHAGKTPEEDCKRSDWWETDLRSHIEYVLSDWELKSNHVLRQTMESNPGRWIPIQVVSGFKRCVAAGVSLQELLDVLKVSRFLETITTKDGRNFVRHRRFKDLPLPPELPPPQPVPSANEHKVYIAPKPVEVTVKRPLPPEGGTGGVTLIIGGASKRICVPGEPGQDNRCWEFHKGICRKGAACRWSHLLVPGTANLPIPSTRPVAVAPLAFSTVASAPPLAKSAAKLGGSSAPSPSPAPFAAPKAKCGPRPS